MSFLTVGDIPLLDGVVRRTVPLEGYGPKPVILRMLEYFDSERHDDIIVERINRIIRRGGIDDRDIDYLRQLLREHRRIPRGNDHGDYCQIGIPPSWSPTLNVDLNNYNEVLLRRDSSEFGLVSSRFHETVAHSTSHLELITRRYGQTYLAYTKICSIYKIFRIENMKAWMQYNVEKLYLLKKNGSANEKQLFHGTRRKEIISSIVKNGFSKAAIKMHYYGKGIYLSTPASFAATYSAQNEEPVYAVDPQTKAPIYIDAGDEFHTLHRDIQGVKKLRFLFLCRVLCGKEYELEPQTYLQNSEKPFGDFDSHMNTRKGIHCIFNPQRVYPEYLILFEEGTHDYGSLDADLERTMKSVPSSTLIYDAKESNVDGRVINVKLDGVSGMEHYGEIPLV